MNQDPLQRGSLHQHITYIQQIQYPTQILVQNQERPAQKKTPSVKKQIFKCIKHNKAGTKSGDKRPHKIKVACKM